MKVYEIQRVGEVIEGIPVEADGTIRLGEEGRGRQLVRVPVPEGSKVEGGRLMSVPLSGEVAAAVVLIRDHSGYRGGWKLTAPRSEEEWEAIARRAVAHRPPDGNGPLAEGHVEELYRDVPCPTCDAIAPPPPPRRPATCKIIAEGWCAQGEAGRMGGGPEYLLVLQEDEAVELVRWGRLYGKPSVLRVEAVFERIAVRDPFAEALSRLAAARW